MEGSCEIPHPYQTGYTILVWLHLLVDSLRKKVYNATPNYNLMGVRRIREERSCFPFTLFSFFPTRSTHLSPPWVLSSRLGVSPTASLLSRSRQISKQSRSQIRKRIATPSELVYSTTMEELSPDVIHTLLFYADIKDICSLAKVIMKSIIGKVNRNRSIQYWRDV